MCFTMSNHNDVAMFQFKRQRLDQSMLKVCREMPNGRSRWFNIILKKLDCICRNLGTMDSWTHYKKRGL